MQDRTNPQAGLHRLLIPAGVHVDGGGLPWLALSCGVAGALPFSRAIRRLQIDLPRGTLLGLQACAAMLLRARGREVRRQLLRLHEKGVASLPESRTPAQLAPQAGAGHT
jgi:hypothetical protein|eukprot:COSAG06_NODE_26687_length_609_cov_0.968627_2_plen_110_part_00